MNFLHIKKVNYILLWFILLCLPLNLGYHFKTASSLVNGRLIDYLIPTLYLQDILAGLLVVINYKELTGFFSSTFKYLIWFWFVCLLTALTSAFFTSSLFFVIRMFLYVSVAFLFSRLFDKETLLTTMKRVFSILIILLSLLGIAQWLHQGSIFDNYLFFGEQPYSFSTYGINKESFLGVGKVASYGTFRHPNTFGGFLSLILVWFFYNIKSRKEYIIFLLGCLTVFFTLSYIAWISLIFGILVIYNFKNHKLYLLFSSLLLLGSLLLAFIPSENNPSVYRRASLLNSSFYLMRERFLFGYGPTTIPAYIDRFAPSPTDLRLAQPPHNIFILLLLESGFVSLVLFVAFFINRLVFVSHASNITFVLFLQLILLGSFDHYLFTMPQTNFLLWIILLNVLS